jgi:Protein of unknown function (DUF1570)
MKENEPSKRTELFVRCRNMTMFAVLTWLFLVETTLGMERVKFSRDGVAKETYGEILVEAQNGDLMLRARDGRIWIIASSEIKERTKDDEAFAPLTAKESQLVLLGELPQSFAVHPLKHYTIAYNTSRPYAQFVGKLLERLYGGFHNFFKRKGFELSEPETPLVVLVFNSKATFDAYATKELGAPPGEMLAYYNVETNRVAMWDLTGREDLAGKFGVPKSEQSISLMLQDPAAAPMVATIIHEATHQISFNCGMQNRYGDWPFWLSEGLAMYFESPDLSRKSGWAGIGQVNPIRLGDAQNLVLNRNERSLSEFLSDDTRFRDPKLMPEAYAEAWALVFYLIEHEPKEFTAYFKELQSHKPLQESSADERVDLFKKHFGDDMTKFDKEFVRFVGNLKTSK